MFIAENGQHSFGLDISDLALRFVALKKQKRHFSITAYGERLLPPGLMSEGKILKLDELAAIIIDLLKAPDFGRLKIKEVVSCLPETKTFIKLITLPWPKDHNLTNAITQEAQKHIPLLLAETYLDWQVINAKENEYLKILLGIAPRLIVNDYIKLLKLVNLTPTVLEIEAAAISRALLPKGELDPQVGLIILDFGATRSSVTIYSQNTIQFSLTIPVSGVQLTQILAAKNNLTYENAEEIKINQGLQNEVLQEAIKPLLTRLKETLEFCQLNFPQAPAPQTILLTGGGCHLIGLGRLIQNTFNLPVEIANPFANLKGALPQKHAFSYSTAIGLAIRGCQPEKFYDFS
ncbi:MAG: type IV pilus assembly protein PilM [bacterium]